MITHFIGQRLPFQQVFAILGILVILFLAACREGYAQSPPVAPTGLTATVVNRQVQLTWTGSPGATSYWVGRHDSAVGNDIYAAMTPDTSFLDIHVTNGGTYTYYILAVNQGGQSPKSNQVSVTLTPLIPAIPTNVTAAADISRVTLLWHSSGHVTYSDVKRATTPGGPYTTLPGLGSTGGYTDKAVTNGTTYYYIVTDGNTGGESAYSGEVSATPMLTVPHPPQFGLIGGLDGAVLINFAWPLGATDVYVKRSTISGGPYSVIQTSPYSEDEDSGLINGTTYYYVMSASNSVGESANSPEQSAIPYGPPSSPALTVTSRGNGTLAISWTPSYSATAYNLFRSTQSGGPYSNVIQESPDLSYTDADVTIGQTYYYVVTAMNGGAASPNSAEASGIPGNLPDFSLSVTGPTDHVARGSSISYTVTINPINEFSGSVNLDATVADDTPGITKAFSPNPTTGSATLTVTTSSATVPTMHDVTVTGTSGALVRTVEMTITVDPLTVTPPPSGLTATPNDSQVTLNWSSPTEPDINFITYNIKRSTTSGGPYALINTTIADPHYIDTTLTNGTTYFYVVSALNSLGEGANSAEAGATPHASGAAPSAPVSLTAVGGNGYVTLSWPASVGATSYNVKRTPVSGLAYTTIGTPSGTTFVDIGRTNGKTYYYVVSAVNSGGEGSNSVEEAATPLASFPAAPTGLTATPGHAIADLNWNASVGAASYNVKRATVSGGPYGTVASPTGTNYHDSGLTNGTTYYYVVSAVNANGESLNSAQASALPYPFPPSASTGIIATPGINQVTLVWDATPGATSYNVKQSVNNGGPYATVGSPNSASYTNTGLSAGMTYYYVVSAVNAGGESADSSQASGVPMGSPPPTPGNFHIFSVSDAQVVVAWDHSNGSTSYNVKRGTTHGGPYTATMNTTAQAFIDTGLTNGTTYYYVVRAVNDFGESANSSELNASPQAPLPPPPSPVNITDGDTQVTLTWSQVASATSYNVQRSTVSGGPYASIASTSATTFNDTGLTNGTVYCYVVASVNGNGQGPNSSQVAAMPRPLIPPAPTALSATPCNGQVFLTWAGSIWDESYKVKIATVSGGPYTTIGFPTATSFTVNGVVNGTTYFFVVSSFDGYHDSANSSEVSATPAPPPPVPSGLTATPGDSTITLTWNPSAGATAYSIERSTTSGGPYAGVANSMTPNSSYVDPAVMNGKTYYYVVTAVNCAGISAKSSEVSATPYGIPAYPLGLTAVAGDREVSLTWIASAGATSYNVMRSLTDRGPYSTIANTAATSYTNTGLVNGTAYYYVVSAVSPAGEGLHSVQASATPFGPDFSLSASPGNISFAQGMGGAVTITIAPVYGFAGAVTLSATGLPQGVAAAFGTNPATGSSTLTLASSAGAAIGSATVTITGVSGSLTHTTSISLNVTPLLVLSTIVVTPSLVSVKAGATQSFSAIGKDQFGNALSPQPTITWSLPGGGGTINSATGLFTAGNVAGGPFTVAASSGGVTGTAAVTVTALPFTDFNGDGKPDLILENSGTRQIALWYLNGTAVAGGQYVAAVPPAGWAVAGSDDFNRDGKPDLILQNGATKQIALWYMNGASVTGGQYVSGAPPAGWNVVAVKDFTGDGKPDLLLQNTAANKLALWTMNGANVVKGQYLSLALPSGWTVAGSGDFNGDGKNDLALVNAATRKVALWYLNGPAVLSGAVLPILIPTGWNIAAVEDFNGDGKPDLALENAATRQTALWYVNGATVSGGAYLTSTPPTGWQVNGPR